MFLDWLVSLGASFPDLVMFLMGIGVFLVLLDTRKDLKIERQDLKDLRKSQHELDKELREKYHRVDALGYGTGIAVQAWTGIQLLNESANGDGDHSLYRHIPTLRDKVDV